MTRLLVCLFALTLGSVARAEVTEVKVVSVNAASMKDVRRIDVDPSYVANFVVRPWSRSDARFESRKAAADKAALAVTRVEVTVAGDRMSIRLGERVDGTWAPLRAGSRIDLVVDVPARLVGLPPRRQPVEPSGVAGAVADHAGSSRSPPSTVMLRPSDGPPAFGRQATHGSRRPPVAARPGVSELGRLRGYCAHIDEASLPPKTFTRPLKVGFADATT